MELAHVHTQKPTISLNQEMTMSRFGLLVVAACIMSPVCMSYNLLYSGVEMLDTGKSLASVSALGSVSSSSYVLTMQNDCNLVLYDRDNQSIWATNTAGLATGCHLVMQEDGKLVIYNDNLNSVWYTDTSGGCGNYVLIMQSDGNLVVYGTSQYARWAANTLKFITPSTQNSTSSVPKVTAKSSYSNVMYSGDQVGSTLAAGKSLAWGAYTLKMKKDCNLVMYDSGSEIWSTKTAGKSSGCHLKLESNGNLVVYTKKNVAVWSSESGGEDGYYVLVLQKDRNLVIYGSARWASGTYQGFKGVLGAAAQYQIAAARKLNATGCAKSTKN